MVPFAVPAEGLGRRSDDYVVPGAFGSDTLRDSFADSASYSFGASWITSKGYLGAAYTRQDSEYGLSGHSHEGGVCHLHGLALHCESHDLWEDPFLGADAGHTARSAEHTSELQSLMRNSSSVLCFKKTSTDSIVSHRNDASVESPPAR